MGSFNLNNGGRLNYDSISMDFFKQIPVTDQEVTAVSPVSFSEVRIKGFVKDFPEIRNQNHL